MDIGYNSGDLEVLYFIRETTTLPITFAKNI